MSLKFDLDEIAALPPEELMALPVETLRFLEWQARWRATARPEQLPPEGDWLEWGLQAGRGFGKTRVGAEWLSYKAITDPEAMPKAVIAPTMNDVRYTCFEGNSGILNIIPPEFVVDYNKTNLIITLTNGGIIRGFGSESPERLRGPQNSHIWCFIGGTLITMADGLHRELRDVVAGDMVMTRFGSRKVLTAGKSPNPTERVLVAFDNKSALVGTADHPVMTNDGWVALGALGEGDEVWALGSDGAMTTTAVEHSSTMRSKPDVYGLTVEGVNEFIANGIVVHNCDELAAWQNAQETWDMAMMGLRLGPEPQVVWTTTPKPIELVRKLTVDKPKRVITRGATFDNKANLPQSFLDKMEEDYAGTTMGRQEILGELIDPEEAGIIKRSWFRLWPAKKPLPQLEWVIMSLDTAFTEASVNKKTRDADYSACTVWGVFRHEGKSNCLLLDCWQEQLGLPDLIQRVRKESKLAYGDDQDSAMIVPMYGSSKPQTSGKKVDMIIIEDKGSGISLRQSLEREGIMAYAYNPGRADKLTRLHMVSAVFARRQVWLPESSKYPGRPVTWAEPMVAQLCAFTGSGSIKHDDILDSVTQSIRLMMDKNLLTFDRKEERAKRDADEREFERGPRKAVVNPYAV